MRNKVTYEWTLETIEEGEIVDCDFADTLTSEWINVPDSDLGLVRSEGNEDDGITDRVWAYVKDGKLPECFSNSMGTPITTKVPQQFHNELKKINHGSNKT